jgi:hypothetical protein
MKRTSGRACRDYERVWRDLCVDRGLEDEWLERLNRLETLSLVGICEGHPDQQPGAAGRFPHVHLRLKESLLPGIAGHWEDLRAAMLNEVGKLFQLGDTDVRVELKFWLRAGRGKLVYREDLIVHVRSYRVREGAEMDTETRAWFGRAVDRIAEIDRAVHTWHGKGFDA